MLTLVGVITALDPVSTNDNNFLVVHIVVLCALFRSGCSMWHKQMLSKFAIVLSVKGTLCTCDCYAVYH